MGALPTILSEILNLAASGQNVQSDWNQSDNEEPDYIKNKPDLLGSLGYLPIQDSISWDTAHDGVFNEIAELGWNDEKLENLFSGFYRGVTFFGCNLSLVAHKRDQNDWSLIFGSENTNEGYGFFLRICYDSGAEEGCVYCTNRNGDM